MAETIRIPSDEVLHVPNGISVVAILAWLRTISFHGGNACDWSICRIQRVPEVTLTVSPLHLKRAPRHRA